MMRTACFCVAALGLSACSPAPPSWDALLGSKIAEHYPAYTVLMPQAGQLLVQRPGQMDKAVDVADIAKFCQRGPADCNYAMDRMLLELRGAQ
jgi:hypothetical protein